MTDCGELSDRMVEVAHGGASWTPAERDHLAGCEACRRELALVTAAAGLGARLSLDVEGVAARVTARLAAPVPLGRPSVRRIGRWVVGLAAAAVLVVAVRLGTGDRSRADQAAAPLILGELEGLSASELEVVLDEMPGGGQPVMPAGAAGMSDLSAEELEQVLAAWGG